MGKKADLKAALVIGSIWEGFCALNNGEAAPMGRRRVDKHRSADIQMFNLHKNSPSYLSYPKQTDMVDISNHGNTIKIKYFEDGRNWSTVTYERVKD